MKGQVDMCIQRTLASRMVAASALSVAAAVMPSTVCAQASSQAGATGVEWAGLPAVNFDSDEGFGYGVAAELYQYGEGTAKPYMWTLQPRVYFTTKGRRDVSAFFDAPHVLPAGWRMDVSLGVEDRLATPYFGMGNATAYDPALDTPDGPDPYYYAFGRLRRAAVMNLQRDLGRTPARALMGLGVVSSRLDPIPGDGITLYGQELGTAEETSWTSYVRAGLVWDTRDRETGPRRGSWTELLVQWVDERFGADVAFTRWTFADRRYWSLTDRLVLAHRYLLQTVRGDAPVHELQRIQGSFRQAEGVGGGSSVRGLPRNRFTGRGLLVWNTELRMDLFSMELLGRSFHWVVSGFVDQGRVWSGGVRPSELLSDLHRGYGGGIHGRMGENFTGSLDVATSSEATLQMYIGLGYLF